VSVKIRLTEGEELTLDVDVAEWTKAFEEALANDKSLRVVDSSGKALVINPQSILYYVEDAPDQKSDVPREVAAH